MGFWPRVWFELCTAVFVAVCVAVGYAALVRFGGA